MKILFICTQNVFRSFSAQVILEKLLKEKNISHFLVDSAGTHAFDWETPYSFTYRKLESLRIPHKNPHSNKKVNQSLLNTNDVIICMTQDHKDFILDKFLVDESKITLFNTLALGINTDLQDDNETTKIGKTHSLQEFVEYTIEYIYEHMPKLLENLKKKN